jgi:hypothetical protein
MACWNPSTSHTNRGLQEWPVGTTLPHIPIEDYKNVLLTESLYLTVPAGHSCTPLLLCEVEWFQQAILVILYWYVR